MPPRRLRLYQFEVTGAEPSVNQTDGSCIDSGQCYVDHVIHIQKRKSGTNDGLEDISNGEMSSKNVALTTGTQAFVQFSAFIL